MPLVAVCGMKTLTPAQPERTYLVWLIEKNAVKENKPEPDADMRAFNHPQKSLRHDEADAFFYYMYCFMAESLAEGGAPCRDSLHAFHRADH